MISGSPEKKNSSDPFLSLMYLENLITHTFVAQQVEHPAVNREVEGSNPSKGANKALTQRNRHSLRQVRGWRIRRSVFSVIPLMDG